MGECESDCIRYLESKCAARTKFPSADETRRLLAKYNRPGESDVSAPPEPPRKPRARCAGPRPKAARAELRERAYALLREGGAPKDVARILGCSLKFAYSRRAELGMARVRKCAAVTSPREPGAIGVGVAAERAAGPHDALEDALTKVCVAVAELAKAVISLNRGA